MRANRYMIGACVLGCAPSKRKTNVVGDVYSRAMAAPSSGQDWGAYFVDPTGISYAINKLLNPSGDPGYAGKAGAAQSAYWAQQRAGQQQALASSGLLRQQAAQQIQTALRQQQAANLAALQAQLARMPQNIATAYAPPQSSTTSGFPPSAPSAGWGGAPSPDGSPDGDTTTLYDSQTNPGMTIVGAAAVDPQYLVIKVKNMADVIAKQGGALGNFGYSLTPQTMANFVYGQMAGQFKQKMAAEGVDADVAVTADPPTHKPPSGGVLVGAAVGVGAVGLGALLWKYVLKGLL